MKKHSLILVLLISLNILTAQNIFEQYQKDPAASYLSVSPKMFEMLGKLSLNTDDPQMNGFIDMVKSMDSFKVLSTKSGIIAQDMESWIANQIEQTELETIMNLSEKDVDVQFCVVYGSDYSKVDRLVMYVKGAQKFANKEGLDISNINFILLSVEGDIDLNQVATLTEVIDIPGGEFLKEIN
ncbi:DUF4252 domain-containing protein [Flavobacteriaceae bacterium]|nr:DUF4252 domain-containing protein [Flavobacteriaceae bacterium]